MFGGFEALLSFIARQVGLRTDVADPAGSLHAKIAAVQSTSNSINSNISNGVLNRTCIASNTIRFSANTPRKTRATTPTRVKCIIVNSSGICRVSFDLCANGVTAYGRVYRNGTAYGTQRSTGSSSYVTYTEDLAFSIGDMIELYIWSSSSSYTAFARNFRVLFDYVTPSPDGMVVAD